VVTRLSSFKEGKTGIAMGQFFAGVYAFVQIRFHFCACCVCVHLYIDVVFGTVVG